MVFAVVLKSGSANLIWTGWFEFGSGFCFVFFSSLSQLKPLQIKPNWHGIMLGGSRKFVVEAMTEFLLWVINVQFSKKQEPKKRHLLS